jgi:DNA replication protein DnaC
VALDSRILAAARRRHDERVRAFQAEREARLKAVYAAVPEAAEIDRALRALVMEAVNVALQKGEDPVAAVEEIGLKSLALQEKRGRLLEEAGFPRDYTDKDYYCDTCRDSGYAGTAPCQCLLELYAEEQNAALSSLFKAGNESFDAFDLSWYDDAPAPGGVSPRRVMEVVFDACVTYARRFSETSESLLFSGPTGVGKTFLSACIARAVAEQGYSVVYETAGAVFAAFEADKFQKGDDPDATRAHVRRVLTCDLLIIDDLGTEMVTSFTVSALYEIINTRLITGKKTIISTNLSKEELQQRYSPQIASRLLGEFRFIRFAGEDIRLKKKRAGL